MTHIVVSDNAALMAKTSLADELTGVDARGRMRAVQLWIDAERDSDAVDETVDMVMDGEEDTSESFARTVIDCLVCQSHQSCPLQALRRRPHPFSSRFIPPPPASLLASSRPSSLSQPPAAPCSAAVPAPSQGTRSCALSRRLGRFLGLPDTTLYLLIDLLWNNALRGSVQ